MVHMPCGDYARIWYTPILHFVLKVETPVPDRGAAGAGLPAAVRGDGLQGKGGPNTSGTACAKFEEASRQVLKEAKSVAGCRAEKSLPTSALRPHRISSKSCKIP